MENGAAIRASIAVEQVFCNPFFDSGGTKFHVKHSLAAAAVLIELLPSTLGTSCGPGPYDNFVRARFNPPRLASVLCDSLESVARSYQDSFSLVVPMGGTIYRIEFGKLKLDVSKLEPVG